MGPSPTVPDPSDPIVDRHSGLVLRTLLVSGLTLTSRILGFVREVLSAAIFGDTSAIYDAFVTAWRVPNLFRRFFGEGAISTALQTAITEADGDGGDEAGRRLFHGTLKLTLGLLVLVCVGTMAIAWVLPDTMPGTGWAWLGADPEPVRELVVRLLPFVVLVCLAALCAGALQVRGHFVTPNLAPVAMNVVWIGALLFIGWTFVWGDEGAPAAPEARQMDMARVLAWGALLSGAVQLLVQMPALARFGLLRGPGDGPGSGTPPPAGEDERVRAGAWTVIKTSAPLALGAAVYQINVMIDGFMAEGLLRDGGPSAHYFANRIQQFPLALIAIAATSAVFPKLKALGHRGRGDELRELHDRAQLSVCFLALPAGVGLFVLAQPIATVLFEHGQYAADGVSRIAAALRMLALALLPAGAVGLVGRCYFSMGDFRTPVRVSIGTLVLNVLLNVLLVVGLDMDVEGLALATAVTSWINLGWLIPGLHRRLGLPRSRISPWPSLLRMGACAAGAGAAAVGSHRGVASGLGVARPEASVLALVAAAAAGVAGYLVLASLARVPEWVALRGRFGGRP